MANQQSSELIIIGSGPAGLTAAIYAARAQLNPIVIQGDKPGGQLMGTSIVENWPGERSILGPDLMQKMREQAEQQGANLVSGTVTKIIKNDKNEYLIQTAKKESYTTQTVLIATGASPRRLNCPGEQEYWGKGVTTCAVCDGALYRDKRVMVIGGGDSGAEDALFLTKFTDQVTLVQNQERLTASKVLAERVLTNKTIQILYNSTITQFDGNEQHLTEVTVKNLKTDTATPMKMDGAFLAIGLDPNSSFCQDLVAVNQWGYITVNKRFETSQPGIFAAGDVHDYRYRQAVTAAGDGCKAALEIERYITNTKGSTL